jgi:hypothetical protein
MKIIGKGLGFLGRALHGTVVKRQVLLTSCEGPYSSVLNGLLGQIESVHNGPSATTLVIKSEQAVTIEGHPVTYFAALPRHVGYDADALLLVPITVNLVALEQAVSPASHESFVAVCTARLRT